MNQLPPWSYSMLDMFDNCNRQAFHAYILKEKGPQTAAMKEGNKFDKAIEDRIKHGFALPPDYQQYEPLAASICATKQQDCQIYTQMKLGIDREFKPAAFFSDKVWGRGALDVAIVKRRVMGSGVMCQAVINDWKTGKNNENKPYSNKGLQLKIFALLMWKNFPGVDKITAFNSYVKENDTGNVYVYTRADEAKLWREVIPKVMAMEKAMAENKWPEKSGPLCGYCNVKSCPHNKS